jgi:beta-phosphoglucomutase
MRNVEIFELLKPDLTDDERIRHLDVYKEELYREHFAAYAQLLPGLVDVLDVLKKRGIPCAIGTSAPRANVDAVLDRFGIHDFFAHIVTSEDVTRGKPDPEVFVKCMTLLCASSEDTYIFEDSPGGVKAAVASRAHTIAVGGTHAESALRALGARDFIADFTALTFV